MNKAAMFEPRRSRFVVRGMAHQERFFDKRLVAEAIENSLKDSELGVIGYVDDESRIHDIAMNGLVEFIPDEPTTTFAIALNEGDIYFSWLPENRCLPFRWDSNLQVNIGLCDGASFTRVISVLTSFVSNCDLFWGEANDRFLTNDQPSFCGLNAHYLEVPQLGTANFFGEEYVRFFGGVRRFESIPGVAVSRLNRGVLTVFDQCKNHTEFASRQKKAMAHLGNERFSVASGDMPIFRQLFWGGAPERGGGCARTAADTPSAVEVMSQYGLCELGIHEESEEWDHLLQVAIKSALHVLYESGNLFPTLFIREREQIRYFSFECAPIDRLRTVARETIRTKSRDAIAYAFVMDTILDADDGEGDALLVECGYSGEANAAEYLIPYERSKLCHGDWIPCGSTDNLLC